MKISGHGKIKYLKISGQREAEREYLIPNDYL
jgi:hypothetical protein